MDDNPNKEMPAKAQVRFDCRGQATGKMRNELEVHMKLPFEEGPFVMATDEGSFHGGDATAPPPLSLFVAGLTGCIMTQIRAFAKRLNVSLNNLNVETRVTWNWEAKDRIYETSPQAFEIDVFIDSEDDDLKVIELINAAKKGCFIEQTLGQANTIRHRMKKGGDWIEI